LFEDALEVEENICASRRIPEQVDVENHYLLEPVECQYSCVDNYIFIVDQNLCYSNTALSSFSEHCSEEEVNSV
jgi:hypothetical protein